MTAGANDTARRLDCKNVISLTYFGRLALNRDEWAIGIDIFGNPPGSNEKDMAALVANFERFGLGSENHSMFTADSASLGPDDLSDMAGGKKIRLFSEDGAHSGDLTPIGFAAANGPVETGAAV